MVKNELEKNNNKRLGRAGGLEAQRLGKTHT